MSAPMLPVYPYMPERLISLPALFTEEEEARRGDCVSYETQERNPLLFEDQTLRVRFGVWTPT